MGPQRPDRPFDADEPDEEHTVADAYSPPVPPSKATSSRFMIGVLAIVALCVIVFVVALALR